MVIDYRGVLDEVMDETLPKAPRRQFGAQKLHACLRNFRPYGSAPGFGLCKAQSSRPATKSFERQLPDARGISHPAISNKLFKRFQPSLHLHLPLPPPLPSLPTMLAITPPLNPTLHLPFPPLTFFTSADPGATVS